MSDHQDSKQQDSKDDLEEDDPHRVYFYLGSIPIDNEFIDEIGRVGRSR